MAHSRRRRWLLAAGALMLGCVASWFVFRIEADGKVFEHVERWVQFARESMLPPEEQDAAEVERLYSTRLIRFKVGKHIYEIPSNYFGPKEGDYRMRSKLFEAEGGFGFSLFLPNFGGYTKENWRNPFDPRRIDVIEVKSVDREQVVRERDASRGRRFAGPYDDAKSQFVKNIKGFLEDTPAFRRFGLEGYYVRYRKTYELTWTGRRTNGDFVYFSCSPTPEEIEQAHIPVPQCRTQYYSEEDELRIFYTFHREHLAEWRAIDDAIWAKIHKWRGS